MDFMGIETNRINLIILGEAFTKVLFNSDKMLQQEQWFDLKLSHPDRFSKFTGSFGHLQSAPPLVLLHTCLCKELFSPCKAAV